MQEGLKKSLDFPSEGSEDEDLPVSPRFKQTITVTIVGSELRKNDKGKPFTVFLLLVVSGDDTWIVLRRYSQFRTLHEKVQQANIKKKTRKLFVCLSNHKQTFS